MSTYVCIYYKSRVKYIYQTPAYNCITNIVNFLFVHMYICMEICTYFLLPISASLHSFMGRKRASSRVVGLILNGVPQTRVVYSVFLLRLKEQKLIQVSTLIFLLRTRPDVS